MIAKDTILLFCEFAECYIHDFFFVYSLCTLLEYSLFQSFISGYGKSKWWIKKRYVKYDGKCRFYFSWMGNTKGFCTLYCHFLALTTCQWWKRFIISQLKRKIATQHTFNIHNIHSVAFLRYHLFWCRRKATIICYKREHDLIKRRTEFNSSVNS